MFEAKTVVVLLDELVANKKVTRGFAAKVGALNGQLLTGFGAA